MVDPDQDLDADLINSSCISSKDAVWCSRIGAYQSDTEQNVLVRLQSFITSKKIKWWSHHLSEGGTKGGCYVGSIQQVFIMLQKLKGDFADHLY